MRDLIDQLCSPACAGRAPGTPGGERARAIVVEAFRAAGLDPHEQRVESSGGANVLARVWRAIAAERTGRGVILAAFDGEEPPAFLAGSTEFVRRNRDPIDFMVCMDLVGH